MGGSGGRTLDLRVPATDAGARLADALERWLSRTLARPVPRARVRALVAAGQVMLDGVVSKAPGRRLRAGERVQAVVRPDLLRPRAERTDRPFRLTDRSVLFEDAALLAVDKPPGIPTHATADPSRPNLVAHVERYLKAQGRGAYVGVHQRLDRDTSGVVLFAIDPRANAGLARAFEERRVEKTYVALAARPAVVPAGALVVRSPLPGEASGREEGGRAAETEIVVREVLPEAVLVEAKPRTGRRHQVRIHLAARGLAILGDPVHGGAGERAPRLMLHARRLALPHPLTGKPLVIESPLPEDFVRALARLRDGARRS